MSELHPLWRPFETPTDEEVARARVAPVVPTPVEVVPPDPGWADDFRRVRAQVQDALGERVLSIEHVGSTSVPGLWAKPVIDVDVTVADSGDEAAYLPDLEAAGFVLTVREPEWQEHRCLRGSVPAANVHVWSPGAVEPQRHLAFRDWLLEHEDDRAAYGDLKARLAAQGFTDVMDYNNAKGGFIYDVYERILAADPAHRHTPQPRG
ncbi:MAG TPA: GrpB family protein [Nocardioides sp.]|nr:GrpB family protein [Nocardioides sp.]